MGNSFSFEGFDTGNETIEDDNNNNNTIKRNLASSLFKEEEDERKKYLLSIKELENKFKLSAQESHKLKLHRSSILIQKIWRGYSARKKWSLFLKKSQVIKELLITERDYVEFLKTIVNIYMIPLRDLSNSSEEGGGSSSSNLTSSTSNKEEGSSSSSSSSSIKESLTTSISNSKLAKTLHVGGGSGSVSSNSSVSVQNLLSNLEQPPLTSEEVKIVFSQIEVILLYNSKLLEKLASRIMGGKWNFYQKIGDVFLEFTHFLKVPYSHYITNFPSVLKVLESASKRPSYVLFIQECKHLPEVGRRDLQSFVSMPVQRCPRYVLLLRELLKYTPSTNHDFKNIVSALTSMETIADLINKQMKDEEISREIMAINEKLTPKVKNLIKPHRRLIKEGEVKVYKADGNDHDIGTGTIRPASSIWKIQNPRFRYIYLFNDCFVVAKKTKTLYKVEQFVKLKYSTVIDHSKSIKIIETIPSDDQLNKYNSVDNSNNNLENVCNNSNNSNNNNNESSSSSSSSSDLGSSSNIATGSVSNRKMSFSSFIENSIKSGKESIKGGASSAAAGDKYYFKLHTLKCTLVICLPNEEEKEQWKNAFINVINQVTENTLSFNPKWSTNPGFNNNNIDLTSNDIGLTMASFTSPSLNRISPYHSKLASPMRGTLITDDNFSMQSIEKLLSISKPIKGMEHSTSTSTMTSTISTISSSSSSTSSSTTSTLNEKI